ncbi:hypothetical protein [Nocardioides deserti]|uniref:Uncharacterized protein n=1 Tax=Nocardioides deserti TaxID=1588644 RepID=A0ABR6U4S8_9ACTN|nr:hypothetical protein [Nocardioides deserti]MBC2959412.1 hypothetical protein [Nocardioides deserti]GGO73435.1 hypothetical protein GCM10012276_19040 [Nocardioides deserti]
MTAAVLGTYVVAPVVLAPTAAVAAPPGCPTITVQDATRQADGVFRGTVEDVRPVTGTSAPGSPDRYEHQVTVGRVWKGGLSTQRVLVRTEAGSRPSEQPGEQPGPRACPDGLGQLETGEEYLFFVDRRASGWLAEPTSRTAPLDDRLLGQVTRLLGSGRAPVPVAPETAQFTRVADGEPASLTRTAAPGLAMVIVGLLGLAVVRGLGRR